MKRMIKQKEARKILGKIPQHVGFWLCTNRMIYSLRELEKSLNSVDDEIFRYHVNRDKNDFERWIRDIIKDKELAREIARIKTKETLVRKISERIKELNEALKNTAGKKNSTKKAGRAKKQKTARKTAKKKNPRKKAAKTQAKAKKGRTGKRKANKRKK